MLKIIWPLAAVLGLTSLAVLASGRVGNGTDKSFGSAWLLQSGQERVIQVCYVVSPEILALKLNLEKEIRDTFKTWEKYIKNRGFIARSYEKQFEFVTKINITRDCSEPNDLKIYFGTKEAQIEKDFAYYDQPFAFAEREKYDSKLGWSKGFIWVMNHSTLPDWKVPGSLRGVLLHEVGHLLGNGHMSNTAMTDNLLDIVSMNQEGYYRYGVPMGRLFNIDDWNTLAVCHDRRFCGIEIQSPRVNSKYSESHHVEGLEIGFEKLTGRKPVLPVYSKFKFEPSLPDPVLELVDAHDKHSFPFKWESDFVFGSNEQVFRSCLFSTNASGLTCYVTGSYLGYGPSLGGVKFYRTFSHSGKEFKIILLQNNRDIGGINIYLFDDDDSRRNWRKNLAGFNNRIFRTRAPCSPTFCPDTRQPPQTQEEVDFPL